MTIKIVAYSGAECNADPVKHLFVTKPQISSIPGISPKEKQRYRVVLGGKILGNKLTLDEALKLAKRGEA